MENLDKIKDIDDLVAYITEKDKDETTDNKSLAESEESLAESEESLAESEESLSFKDDNECESISWAKVLKLVLFQVEFIKKFFTGVQTIPYRSSNFNANFLEHPDKNVVDFSSYVPFYTCVCSHSKCRVKVAQGYSLDNVFKLFYSNHLRELSSDYATHIPKIVRKDNYPKLGLEWIPLEEKLVSVENYEFFSRNYKIEQLIRFFKILCFYTKNLLELSLISSNSEEHDKNVRKAIDHIDSLSKSVSGIRLHNNLKPLKIYILSYGIANGKSSTLKRYKQFDNEMSFGFRLKLNCFDYRYLPKIYYPIFTQLGLLYKAIEGIYIQSDALIVSRSWIDHQFFASKEGRENYFDSSYYSALFGLVNSIRNNHLKDFSYKMILFTDDTFIKHKCSICYGNHASINYDSIALKNIRFPFNNQDQDRNMENDNFTAETYFSFMSDFRLSFLNSLITSTCRAHDSFEEYVGQLEFKDIASDDDCDVDLQKIGFWKIWMNILHNILEKKNNLTLNKFKFYFNK